MKLTHALISLAALGLGGAALLGFSRQDRAAQPGTVVADNPTAARAPGLDETARHPRGFTFAYPSGWQCQAGGEGIVLLTPADVLRNGQGAAELFMAIGDDARGLDRPDAPGMIALAEATVRQLLPALERTGDVTTARVAGREAASIQWAGTTPTGLEARAAMSLTIVKQTVMALLLVTTDERFSRREREANAIFATFAYEASGPNARLVGTWRHDTSHTSGQFTMATSTYLHLDPDGTCRRGGTKMAGGTASSSISSRGGGFVGGTWSVTGRQITLRWNDGGTERWRWICDGRKLLLRAGGAKMLWTRTA